MSTEESHKYTLNVDPEPVIPVLYQDDYIVAVDKPHALLVHKTRQAPGESRALMQLLRDQMGRHVYTVHRLDRATSGVILFALDSATARTLCESFREREVSKRYLAVTRGWLEPEEQTFDMPLLSENRLQSQPASTHFRSLARASHQVPMGRYPSARFSLLEASPLSGRRHQIRRHLKHLNHPIIGDSNHGDSTYNAYARNRLDNQRLLLHAYQLTVWLPWLGEKPLCVKAELPACFRAVCEKLGWAQAISAFQPTSNLDT